MNREIKLKIWDDESKVFLETGADDIYWNCTEGDLTAHLVNEKGDWQQLQTLQYTGFKDKDGAEIYEGDIVGGYPHGTVEVIWESEAGFWEAHWTEDEYNDDGETVKVEKSALFSNELDNCKDEWTVIGNIYENPELLP